MCISRASQGTKPRKPITTSACILGGDPSAEGAQETSGRRGGRQGQMRIEERGLTSFTVPPNHSMSFAAGRRAWRSNQPTSRPDDLATPVPLPQRRTPGERSSGRAHLTGRTLRRYFGPEPWPSCRCCKAQMCLDDGGGQVHTRAANDAPGPCSASAEPATQLTPSTQARARLRCLDVSTAAIYPVGPS